MEKSRQLIFVPRFPGQTPAQKELGMVPAPKQVTRQGYLALLETKLEQALELEPDKPKLMKKLGLEQKEDLMSLPAVRSLKALVQQSNLNGYTRRLDYQVRSLSHYLDQL